MELDLNLAQIFLNKNNLQNCQITKIAGDASFRSYYRILNQENGVTKNYILMFAPKNYEDIKPFIKIDKILLGNGFSAPQIIAQDDDISFLLLEDFGDKTYTKYLKNSPESEIELYYRACDALINLHKILPNQYDIPKYNNAVLYREVALFLDWYLPYKNIKISQQQISNFKHQWFELFDKLNKNNQVIVLRDYHADNLMLLDDRDSFQSVGLLDFQDALIGSYAYDLVSLLEDARRDLQDLNREKIFDYFVSKANYNFDDFWLDYEIISLQRNIKILGIFARLFLRDNKKQYLEYLPRVKNFVKYRLDNSKIIQNDFKSFINACL